MSLLKDLALVGGWAAAAVSGLALYLQRRDKRPHIKLKAYPGLAIERDLRRANREEQTAAVPAYRLVALCLNENGTVLEEVRFKPLLRRARVVGSAISWHIPGEARATRESVMPPDLLLYRSKKRAFALGRFTARDLQDRRYRSRLTLLSWRHLDEYSEGVRHTGFFVRLRTATSVRENQDDPRQLDQIGPGERGA